MDDQPTTDLSTAGRANGVPPRSPGYASIFRSLLSPEQHERTTQEAKEIVERADREAKRLIAESNERIRAAVAREEGRRLAEGHLARLTAAFRKFFKRRRHNK